MLPLIPIDPQRSRARQLTQRHYPAVLALAALIAIAWAVVAGKLPPQILLAIVPGILAPDWRRSFASPHVLAIKEKVAAYHNNQPIAPQGAPQGPPPIVNLLLIVTFLTIPACLISKHTGALRTLQAQAAARCSADPRTCPQAHQCAAATVKAGEAWAVVAKARKADKESVARGTPPVNLMALQEQERAAQALDDQASALCKPGIDMAVVLSPQDMAPAPDLVAAPTAVGPPHPCHDNLCGGGPFGENYCSCHGSGDLMRCWGTAQRCAQDWACCSARGGCQGTTAGLDDCARQVKALATNDAGVPHGG